MTTSLETPRTRREQHLAAHPTERKVDKALVKKIGSLIRKFQTQGKRLQSGMVDWAELARQIGLLIIELEDTLPGKELTKDFWDGEGGKYHQFFEDAIGHAIHYETLKWFIRIAKNHLEPITERLVAYQCQKMLLLATGDEEYQLIGQREPQTAAPPVNHLQELYDFFDDFDLMEKWNALKRDEKTFPGGKIRPGLVPRLAAEWGPKLKEYDAFSAELHRELGV